MKKTAKPMVRINTRIRADQSKYIKALAKKSKLTEGDVIRNMLDAYILAGE